MESENKVLEIKVRIADLKTNLLKTDYQAIKYAEGEMSFDEFAPIKSQRKAWRDEINLLEQQLKTM